MLKAGFSRIDITPPLGTPLAGYFYDRFAKGILDPLSVNAIAMNDGENTAIMVAVDALGITTPYADKIRDMIVERTGVDKDHVIVAALHQHTSVRIADPSIRSSLTDTAFLDVLYRKIADSALLAVNDMAEATVETADKETAEPISFVRRFLMKDGTCETNPSSRKIPDIVRPLGDADNTVRLLRFKREGKKDIALVNFSTHPDVISGEMISADWPGFVRRFVEEDIKGANCIFFTGVQGDTNHCDRINGLRGGYTHSEFMGRTIADAVVDIWDKTVPVKADRINSHFTYVYNKTRTDGAERYEQCKTFLEAYERGEFEKKPHITVLADAQRVVKMRYERIYQQLPLTVINVGDISFVGFGGEPFTKYGQIARDTAPERRVISICCANGYANYIPAASAFKEGGYEASSACYTPEVEAQIAEALGKMIGK